tara:strand:- start:2457 stop:3398 length:942 start_codon:yes stop_codon:yes gene_type:complete
MRIKLQKFIKYNFLILLFSSFLYSQINSIENKIILNIDNNIVTTVDIENEAKYLKVLNPKLNNLEKNTIFEVAKNSLIKENIKMIEISKYQLRDLDEKYLENIMRNIYEGIGIKSMKEFLDYISNYNIDINTINEKLEIEAKWNQLIYQKFHSKLKIDKKKIKDEIKLNKKFTNSYLLYEILFSAKKNDEAKNKYSKILKSIEKDGFENTASIFSLSESGKTGGQLGWINERSLSKKILIEISKIEKNEITKPILIPGGFLILYIKDIKRVEKKIDIDKEFTLMVRYLQNQQLNQYSNIYFNKITKDIEINEK